MALSRRLLWFQRNSSIRRHIIQPLASDSRRIANDVGVQLLTFYTCTHLGSIAVGSYAATMGFAQKKNKPFFYSLRFFNPFLLLLFSRVFKSINFLKENEISGLVMFITIIIQCTKYWLVEKIEIIF